jgi:hypothetical protein
LSQFRADYLHELHDIQAAVHFHRPTTSKDLQLFVYENQSAIPEFKLVAM